MVSLLFVAALVLSGSPLMGGQERLKTQSESVIQEVPPARQDSKPGSEPAASSRVTAPQNQRPSPPKFADATSALGLSFQYIGSQTSRKYLLETIQKTGPKYWNRLYHQKPDGTFEDRTEKAALQGVGYGMGVAVGDYDNDGYEDLYVTAYIRLVIVSSRLGSPRCRTLLSEC